MGKWRIDFAGLAFLLVFLVDGVRHWLEGDWSVRDLMGVAFSVALMVTFWKHPPGTLRDVP